MRRQFALPEEDEGHLDALGLPWETVIDNNARWLLIHDFPIPEGYDHRTATAAVRVLGYPPGQIDMVYFIPELARIDGKPINNLSTIQLEGKTFQQWSRHYPWDSAEDTLATHLVRVETWLSREFDKR